MGKNWKGRVLLLLVLVAAGCARTVYVPEKQVEYREKVKYDSVVQRDSVMVMVAGDTVYIYRDRWRDRVHTQRDTIRVHDSISYPVVVEKPVRHVPKIYRWSLWIAIAAVAIVIKKVAFR